MNNALRNQDPREKNMEGEATCTGDIPVEVRLTLKVHKGRSPLIVNDKKKSGTSLGGTHRPCGSPTQAIQTKNIYSPKTGPRGKESQTTQKQRGKTPRKAPCLRKNITVGTNTQKGTSVVALMRWFVGRGQRAHQTQ